ncbi:30S ribosomal protein S3 [Candidatus Tiddalikarchaeum anstoanum]|nr:30S ribosomal protein S3 [Candidatus Tiddalikarchaeum anstoanum]
MIERKFIKEKMNDLKIQTYLASVFKNSSYSHTIIQKTPLGEKLIVYSAKPGLIVGKGGVTLKGVISNLKKDYGLQSPQIEVQEVAVADLDPNIVAERVADELIRLGKTRFKFVGHNATQRVMNAGAMGVEVKISGQIPSKRAKAWRFLEGYLPKTGEPSDKQVKEGFRVAQQKLGSIGVTVRILPPNTILPDTVIIIPTVKEAVKTPLPAVEPVKAEKKEEKIEEKAEQKIEKKEKNEPEFSEISKELEAEIEQDILKQFNIKKEAKKEEVKEEHKEAKKEEEKTAKKKKEEVK